MSILLLYNLYNKNLYNYYIISILLYNLNYEKLKNYYLIYGKCASSDVFVLKCFFIYIYYTYTHFLVEVK